MDFTGSKYKDHSGETRTEHYLSHRPLYPQELYDAIISYHKENTPRACFKLVVDVACGSGQATVPLAEYFEKVIGVDFCKDMIGMAPKHKPNVSYKVADAMDMAFLQDSSVDMVTIGTALHWLNIERFCKEVDRILKPGGSFVAFNNICLPWFESEEATNYIQKFALDSLNKYYGVDLVEFAYGHWESLDIPFTNFKRRDDIEINVNWTLDEVIEFLKSLSYSDDYIKDNNNVDVYEEAKEKLTSLLSDNKTSVESKKFPVKLKMWLAMFQKPRN